MRKPGWTLHEMLISLTVAGAIVALASSAAVGQLRFFRGMGEVAALRTQMMQAATIAANVLRDVGSRSDILIASDSAIEVSATIGSAITCAADTGRLRVTRPQPSGATLASFAEQPGVGDAAYVLVNDSAGGSGGWTGGWMRVTAGAEPTEISCSRFPDTDGFSIAIAEPLVIPAGAPVRFTRRTRMSLYRASDGRWYLGLREWNGALNRFNTIQPVAGPLLPHAGSASGLRFAFRDESGSNLAGPIDPQRVAIVTVHARAETVRPAAVPGMSSVAAPFFVDSFTVSVAIRNQ